MGVKLKMQKSLQCWCSTTANKHLQQSFYAYLAVFAACAPKKILRKLHVSWAPVL